MGDLETLRQRYEERRLAEAAAEYERQCAAGPVSAEIHLYGALTAWRLVQPVQGRVAINRALGLEPTGSVRARCHFTSGVLAREYGDTMLAVQEFDDCLATLPQVPELVGILKGPALYNKALALQFTRDRRAEALPLYLQAVTEFRAQGLDDYLRQALQNAAWAAVDFGDYPHAAELLDEAAPLCLTEAGQWVQRVTQAHLACRQGQWVETARLCEWMLSTPAAPIDVRCLAAAVAADAMLQQGNIPEAVVMGRHSVDLALRATDNRCLSAATRIHTRAKQAEAGAG